MCRGMAALVFLREASRVGSVWDESRITSPAEGRFPSGRLRSYGCQQKFRGTVPAPGPLDPSFPTLSSSSLLLSTPFSIGDSRSSSDSSAVCLHPVIEQTQCHRGGTHRGPGHPWPSGPERSAKLLGLRLTRLWTPPSPHLPRGEEQPFVAGRPRRLGECWAVAVWGEGSGPSPWNPEMLPYLGKRHTCRCQ